MWRGLAETTPAPNRNIAYWLHDSVSGLAETTPAPNRNQVFHLNDRKDGLAETTPAPNRNRDDRLRERRAGLAETTPAPNGQVERMNRPLKEATVRRYHYGTRRQLEAHLASFLDASNFARRLKTLKGLTPYEHVCNVWPKKPDRFRLDPTHLTAGLNKARASQAPTREIVGACAFQPPSIKHTAPDTRPESEHGPSPACVRGNDRSHIFSRPGL